MQVCYLQPRNKNYKYYGEKTKLNKIREYSEDISEDYKNDLKKVPEWSQNSIVKSLNKKFNETLF